MTCVKKQTVCLLSKLQQPAPASSGEPRAAPPKEAQPAGATGAAVAPGGPVRREREEVQPSPVLVIRHLSL